MAVDCGRTPEKLDGLLLVADDGTTSIATASLPIIGDESLRNAITVAHASAPFAEEMHLHNLRLLQPSESGEDIEVILGTQIIVRGRNPMTTPCDPPLNRGPFSWSGMSRPDIDVDGSTITIDLNSEVLDALTPAYDPTAFYATLYTITWAANSLHEGRCLELAEPRPASSHLPAHPVLTAEQLEEAAAGLRRGRETLGLVLIALAVLSLALGLRRSVL